MNGLRPLAGHRFLVAGIGVAGDSMADGLVRVRAAATVRASRPTGLDGLAEALATTAESDAVT